VRWKSLQLRALITIAKEPRHVHGSAIISSGQTPVREGITVAQAPANLSAIGRRIKDQCRNEVDLNDAAVAPLADAMVGDMRTLSFFLGASPFCSWPHAPSRGVTFSRNSARTKN